MRPHQHSRRPSCRRSPRSAISPEEPCSELRAVHGARVCTEAYRSDQTKITIVLKGTKLSSRRTTTRRRPGHIPLEQGISTIGQYSTGTSLYIHEWGIHTPNNLAQSSEPTSRSAVALRPLPLAAAGCRRLPLAAGRPPQMENEDYVVAAAAGAAGTRGARRLRRDAVRHREWRAERERFLAIPNNSNTHT